jgi:hypothetical protein
MLKISNGAAADPIGDQCVLQLTLENFALPTLLSRKVAVKVIVELEKAVAGLGRFSAFQRGSLGSAVACMAIAAGVISTVEEWSDNH